MPIIRVWNLRAREGKELALRRTTLLGGIKPGTQVSRLSAEGLFSVVTS